LIKPTWQERGRKSTGGRAPKRPLAKKRLPVINWGAMAGNGGGATQGGDGGGGGSEDAVEAGPPRTLACTFHIGKRRPEITTDELERATWDEEEAKLAPGACAPRAARRQEHGRLRPQSTDTP
jgi:hypothetical protein